ncbi:MAG TPA: T9SS type A sorting domain-containing protein [Flavobacteriales bacterium]|nr:T9SS type A sorting domain-containing protein [Flavobacteriales bacterium]
MPIDLVSFTADLDNSDVHVDWTVASQTNNDYFNIQRSIDGFDWEDIANVAGAGSSSQMLSYSYVDTDPYLGVSYYRLKQTDYDGNFEIFEPVAVLYDIDMVELLISPNPVTDAIRITTDGMVHNDLNIIRIYDVKGNMVLHNNLIGVLKNYSINVDALVPGIYIVKSKNRKQLGAGKFVKE